MPLTLRNCASAAEASAALANERGARYLGGGTLVMRDVNEGDLSFSTLVRTTDRTLARIETSGQRLLIGAGVTYAALMAEREVAFLHPVARSIGGPAVRNMGTVGGNLFAPAPFGDLATALLALDATVLTQGGYSPRETPIEEFLSRARAQFQRAGAGGVRGAAREPGGVPLSQGRARQAEGRGGRHHRRASADERRTGERRAHRVRLDGRHAFARQERRARAGGPAARRLSHRRRRQRRARRAVAG